MKWVARDAFSSSGRNPPSCTHLPSIDMNGGEMSLNVAAFDNELNAVQGLERRCVSNQQWQLSQLASFL